MSVPKFNDVIVSITNGVGTIKLNRPKALNSFGGTLMLDIVGGLRYLNNHPDTYFTVITGEGRFFSSGADVKATGGRPSNPNMADHEKKVAFTSQYSLAVELLRSLIDHKKVLVLALNGPGVGGGAAWFTGVCEYLLSKCPGLKMSVLTCIGS
jgi:Delta3-Delta2-enoyl-CoA isomerase